MTAKVIVKAGAEAVQINSMSRKTQVMTHITLSPGGETGFDLSDTDQLLMVSVAPAAAPVPQPVAQMQPHHPVVEPAMGDVKPPPDHEAPQQ